MYRSPAQFSTEGHAQRGPDAAESRRPVTEALPPAVRDKRLAKLLRRPQPNSFINEGSIAIEKEQGNPPIGRVLPGEGKALIGSDIRNPNYQLLIGELVFDRFYVCPKLTTHGTGDIMNLHNRRDPRSNRG